MRVFHGPAGWAAVLAAAARAGDSQLERAGWVTGAADFLASFNNYQ